ncbi:Glycoside hydrolase family 18, catalytic domain containing protein [Candidatus Nanopelagicaceae bacterium]
MRVLSRIGLALVLFSSLLVAPGAQAEENVPRKILTGWIPYYSMKTALPAALNNTDLIKEVMPFWYTLKYSAKSKKSSVIDLYTPANPSIPMTEPLAAMRSANLQIIPTITDGTEKGVLAGLLKAPSSRTQVVNTLMNLVRANNFDGIDIDFEGFAFVDGNTTWKATAPSWVAFIKELSVALHAENKILSVATPYVLDPAGKQKGYFVYAWAEIASSIDKLRIMTYDYSVAKVGPIGPLVWTERTVQYAISIMPASKVFVGVPGYGRSWITAITGVCPASVAKSVKVGAKAATFVMRDAVTLAATYGATPTYDEKFGEVTFSYEQAYNGTTASGLATSCTASRTAWYQDTRSWTSRAALVNKYRIGGITAWTLGMEEPLAMEAIRGVAKEIAPDQVNVIASVDVDEVQYGKSVSISAQFTIKDKSPIANLPVKIQGRSASDINWRTLSSAVTDAEGKIAKSLLLGKSTSIRIYSESSWERTEGISTEMPVEISRDLFVDAPTSVKSGSAFDITGNVKPRNTAATIRIEKLSGKKWAPLGTDLTTDALGNFVVRINGQSRGVFSFRVTALEDATWKVVTSPTFNIIIR